MTVGAIETLWTLPQLLLKGRWGKPSGLDSTIFAGVVRA